MTVLAAVSCGIDTSTVAGNVSQAMTQESSDDTDEEAQEEAPAAGSEDFLANIPEWSGYAFCYVNGNQPDFAPEEIWTSTQESLDPLDELGRCGTANSCIGRDGMPTEGRGDISDVHPTGWHTERYDFVEGEALYNRCHLIAHQLSGDDAVPRNLITGTSYMNRDGMLPFEETIGNYVRSTGNHVMYRVTPVFEGDELIARGVHMQAISVEDNGTSLAFNVFCYNVQPGIDIDYETGDNKLSEDRTMLEDYQAGKFYLEANTLGIVPEGTNADALAQAGEQSVVQDAQNKAQDTQNNAQDEAKNEKQAEEKSDNNADTYEVILNSNPSRMRYHMPDCRGVDDISKEHYQKYELTKEEIKNKQDHEGWIPCGWCHPDRKLGIDK